MTSDFRRAGAAHKHTVDAAIVVTAQQALEQEHASVGLREQKAKLLDLIDEKGAGVEELVQQQVGVNGTVWPVSVYLWRCVYLAALLCIDN